MTSNTATGLAAAPVDSAIADGERPLDRLTKALHRHTGRVPAELVAGLLLDAHGTAPPEVLDAARAASARRFEIAADEGLRVATRPDRGWRGVYSTRRRREAGRPWRTLITSVDPLVASCDCPDFRGASLGLCKHVAVVVDELAGRRRQFERARAEGPAGEFGPRLVWIPFKPLFGSGDWLERVCLAGGTGGGAAWQRLRRAFGPTADGTLRLRKLHEDRPAARRAVLAELAAVAGRRTTGLPSDPAVAALVAEETERLDVALALDPVRKRLGRTLRGFARQLYDYQVDGVARFASTGRLLLADDMGLGKTTQAVAACAVLWDERLARRGLLIVPASLKSQWVREWEACCDVPITVVDGSPGERAALYRRTRSGFLVANYEQLLRDVELVKAWAPDVVVLDEAQRIKNWATRTAHVVKSLAPRFRLVLTGTPFENRLLELDSILEWLDRRPLQPQWRIEPFHGARGVATGRTGGARHLDVLRERLEPVLLRRRRSEILTQLPSRTDTRIDVPLTGTQRAEHEALAVPIASLMHRAERRPLTQPEFLKLMQLLTQQRIVANGIAQQQFEEVWPGIEHAAPAESLRASLAMPKLDELREIVERVVLDQERKVVVFSQWQRSLKLAHWSIRDLLDANDLEATFFTGAVDQRRRAQNIVGFHEDPAVRVLFATDAGGVGLNLQRAATCCVNFDLPWNPAVLEQRIARIHRLGQEHPIDVYNLVSEDSIEARIALLVRDKHAMFTALFDGDSDEVRFDEGGGFLATVRKLADPDALPQRDDPDRSDGLGLEVAEPEAELEVPAHETPSADVAASPAALESLLAQLDVRPRADGGIRIDAPPEAAATLATLLRGFAGLLDRAATRGET